MKGFIFGLLLGAALGAGGLWAYFVTGARIQEFAEMRCWIAIKMPHERPTSSVDPIAGATELVGISKADRAIELCKLILE